MWRISAEEMLCVSALNTDWTHRKKRDTKKKVKMVEQINSEERKKVIMTENEKRM